MADEVSNSKKDVITFCDGDDEETEDQVAYDLFDENTNQSYSHQQPEEQQQHQCEQYHLRCIQSAIVIRQLRSRGLSFQLWPAASSLVALLDSNSSTLRLPSGADAGRLRILELGSGTGLVGIAAAAALGASVTVTDLPHVLPNLRFNAEANAAAVAAAGGAVDVRQLRWGCAEDAAALLREKTAFDVVLGSDVVYYEHLFDPLLQTLRAFVRGDVVFVMGHLRRWKKESAFFRKARKLFDVVVAHADAPPPGSRIGINIYRLTAKATTKILVESSGTVV